MCDINHTLQQYPDVLCLVAEHLHYKTWKSMRLVCKQFASWLRPYKKLMQQRMCQALEIQCIFFWSGESFREIYHIHQNPFQFAIRYREGPFAQTRLYYLTLNPGVIWNNCGGASVSITPELLEFKPTTTKIDLPNKCKGKFGETWRFCLHYCFLGGADVIKVFLEGVHISSY